jgi:hypothetical protein
MEQVIGNANVTAFLNEFARKGSVEQMISPTGVEENDMVASDSEHSDVTPPASAKLQTYTERETERKRLERLVMEDLGLSVNFPTHEPELAQIRTPRTKVCSTLVLTIVCFIDTCSVESRVKHKRMSPSRFQ